MGNASFSRVYGFSLFQTGSRGSGRSRGATWRTGSAALRHHEPGSRPGGVRYTQKHTHNTWVPLSTTPIPPLNPAYTGGGDGEGVIRVGRG